MNLSFLNETSRLFLEKGYLNGQTPEERYRDIVNRIKDYEVDYKLDGLSERVSGYIEEGIYSFASPTLSNFGLKTEEKHPPLPASCNIITVGNSINKIYYSIYEAAMLSKNGAGVGANFDKVIQKGTLIEKNLYSNTKLDWIEPFVRAGKNVAQGGVRRGYGAPFLSIEDSDFDSLMDKVRNTNVDNSSILINNTVGIQIPKGFMDKIESGDREAQRRMFKVLFRRVESGRIYMIFEDNTDINKSPIYENLNLNPVASNMCTECLTPLIDDLTFNCILLSLNVTKWDNIHPQTIKDAIYTLDIINEEYINLTKDRKGLMRSRKSAIEKRDIGLGAIGFHSLLQKRGIVFGDMESRFLNREIFSTIQKYSIEASEDLAKTLGAPKMCEDAGVNRRNVSLNMIAPNKSTSVIMNTSLGIEPYMSNYFTKKIAHIEKVVKNPNLEELLESKGLNTNDVWNSIMQNNGSVSHLSDLSEKEIKIFRTFSEISPKDIIDLAADRQKYIDMAQSINLMNRPNYTMKDIWEIHKYAHNRGIKTLYYFYPQAHASIEKEGGKWDECESCAG